METHAPEPNGAPPDPVGYIRCCDCGKLVLQSFARQTGRRCPECWHDRSPLATLEVVNRSVRMSARQNWRTKRGRAPVKTGQDRKTTLAGTRAHGRLADLFPDIFAMLVDEERVKLGLDAIARYEAQDFTELSLKTLRWDAVYAALETEGTSDA